MIINLDSIEPEQNADLAYYRLYFLVFINKHPHIIAVRTLQYGLN